MLLYYKNNLNYLYIYKLHSSSSCFLLLATATATGFCYWLLAVAKKTSILRSISDFFFKEALRSSGRVARIFFFFVKCFFKDSAGRKNAPPFGRTNSLAPPKDRRAVAAFFFFNPKLAPLRPFFRPKGIF